MTRRRDLADLLDRAEAEGWAARRCGSGHWRLMHPEAGIAVLPSTPSDHRALANGAALLRRLARAVEPAEAPPPPEAPTPARTRPRRPWRPPEPELPRALIHAAPAPKPIAGDADLAGPRPAGPGIVLAFVDGKPVWRRRG